MKLNQLINYLKTMSEVVFLLPNGEKVPEHYHLTEIGKVSKQFIDCGGVLRKEEKIQFQLWVANDVSHKVLADKWLHIVDLAKNHSVIGDSDLVVEVVY